MIKLTKGRPAASAVPLQGGAVVFVRPATAFEADIAGVGAAKIMAGLVEGREAAAAALDILGDEFRETDFTSRPWIEAAAQRIALIELAALCCESWEGVADETGAPLTGHPSKEHLALLLRDTECGRRISGAIYARVHDEVAEGNGLAASPDGAAKAAEPTATNAAETISPVAAAPEAQTASAVPK